MTRDDELRLHAYLDGELGATESIDFERRLAEDADLRKGLVELRLMSDRIRSQVRYHDAPAGLRESIRSRISQDKPRQRQSWLFWPSLATAMLVIAVVAGYAPSLFRQAVGWTPRVDEVMDGHLRATLGMHWVDVASSDRHTVKPWLSARLGFSPAVPDLADQGFELVGGRVDVLDAKSVAVLVYKRRQHMVSVFVWPVGSDAAETVTSTQHRGYHLLRWSASGFSYWAVSDLNESEMRDFARLLSSVP